jgi:hypothetical protein
MEKVAAGLGGCIWNGWDSCSTWFLPFRGPIGTGEMALPIYSASVCWPTSCSRVSSFKYFLS